MTIVLRYVNDEDEICEDFVEFVECENGITGLALAEKIKSALQGKYGLDMINLRGQCYDGAWNMSRVQHVSQNNFQRQFTRGAHLIS